MPAQALANQDGKRCGGASLGADIPAAGRAKLCGVKLLPIAAPRNVSLPSCVEVGAAQAEDQPAGFRFVDTQGLLASERNALAVSAPRCVSHLAWIAR